jgi:hypothetical protein
MIVTILETADFLGSALLLAFSLTSTTESGNSPA